MPKVKIRVESCKSCGYCVKFCPKKVLDIGIDVNQKGYQYAYVKNQDECVGCAICGMICPDAAIEIWR